MRELLLPGCRRLHFQSEKDSLRRLIASRLAQHGHRAHIHSGRGKSEDVRALLLERLTSDAIDAGVTRLVFDSRDPAGNNRDRQVLGIRTKAHEAGLA
jgi:hypothetical protein